jgi:hypothetical protein
MGMRKALPLLTLASVAVLMLSRQAPARIVGNWPYDRLFKEADLVVVAVAVKSEPVEAQPPAGNELWPYDLVGRNTTLRVVHAIKGEPAGKQITILHFEFGKRRDGWEKGIENGPMLVDFRVAREEPVVTGVLSSTPQYLLFLRKMGDGRYEPLSGQIDPALSVREFCNPPEPPLPWERTKNGEAPRSGAQQPAARQQTANQPAPARAVDGK